MAKPNTPVPAGSTITPPTPVATGPDSGAPTLGTWEGGDAPVPKPDTPDTDTDTDTGDDGAAGDEAGEAAAGGNTAGAPAEKKPSAFERFLAGEAPEWVDELLSPETGSFEISDEDFEGLDIKAKRVLAKMVGAGRQAREGLSKQQADEAAARKAAEEALAARELQTRSAAEDLFAPLRDPKLLELFQRIQQPGVVPPDADSPAGIRFAAQQEAAGFIQQFMSEFRAAAERAQAARIQTQAQQAETKRRAELETWIETNHETLSQPGVYDAVKALVAETKGAIQPERALKIVLAERGVPATDEAKLEARRSVQPGGQVNGQPVPKTPEGLDGEELEAFYERFPSARARDDAEALRKMRLVGASKRSRERRA